MSNIGSGNSSEIAVDIFFERMVFQCLASAEFVRDISQERTSVQSSLNCRVESI